MLRKRAIILLCEPTAYYLHTYENLNLDLQKKIGTLYGLYRHDYTYSRRYNNIFNIPGTYHDALAPNGHVLSDHMLLGSVVATILVVVVTAQVRNQSCYQYYCF